MTTFFQGKVAIVTGGASGMGFETAKRLAQEGAQVAIADINMELAQKSAKAISAIAIRLDQADEESVKKAVEEVEAQLGGLDLAVNAAGILGQVGPIVDFDAKEVERVTAVNFNGVLFSLKHEARAMKKRGAGAIVNIASITGMQPMGFAGLYSASKAAVIAIGQSAATELGPDHIRVNTISPGYINTAMMNEAQINTEWAATQAPLGRCGEPGDIADLATFLLSDRALHIHGANIPIDGGCVAGTGVKPPGY